MNIDDILDSSVSNGSELIVTSEMREFLKETAKWCKFLAIVGFVMMGFGLIVMLLGGTTVAMAMSDMNGMGGMGGMLMTLYLIMFALYVFPLLYMYRFADNTQKALASDDQKFLRDAFENLKSLFKFMGVFMAVILGLYLLMFVGGLLFSMIASF